MLINDVIFLGGGGGGGGGFKEVQPTKNKTGNNKVCGRVCDGLQTILKERIMV